MKGEKRGREGREERKSFTTGEETEQVWARYCWRERR